jgi:hypothetical protein
MSHHDDMAPNLAVIMVVFSTPMIDDELAPRWRGSTIWKSSWIYWRNWREAAQSESHHDKQFNMEMESIHGPTMHEQVIWFLYSHLYTNLLYVSIISLLQQSNEINDAHTCYLYFFHSFHCFVNQSSEINERIVFPLFMSFLYFVGVIIITLFLTVIIIAPIYIYMFIFIYVFLFKVVQKYIWMSNMYQIHICIYIYIYMYIYEFIYIHIYVCIHLYIYIHIHR